jgi:hypothetical protein
MLPDHGTNFLTVAAVVNDHGGEDNFWSQYLTGELGAALRAWVRAQAAVDPPVKAWLAAVEGPDAQLALNRALEAVNYLVEVDADAPRPATGDDELTTLVQGSASADPSPPYRERLRECLFLLLEEVNIRLPADGEAREATALVRVLVGPESVRSFKEISTWLHGLRERLGNLPRRDRLLAALVPELTEKTGNDWRYQLSFRLFLRERFRRHAEERGWQPGGPQFHDLDSAFDALSRQRIGELARAAVTAPDADELQPGWQLACADFAA